jgi:hypothetical protein
MSFPSDLDAARGGLTPADAPVSTADRARAWRARHPVIVALGAVVVLAASAATLWVTVLRPRPALIVLRGHGGDLRLMGTLEPEGTLRLTWPRSPGAAGYSVKLTGSTGTELARSVAQPVLVLHASDVAALGDMTVLVDSEPQASERPAQSTSLTLPKLTNR